MWRQGCRRSNVWIATLADAAPLPELAQLTTVQELPGAGSPFDRLAEHLRTVPFAAAAIDAPFSLPRAYLPSGGRCCLLSRLDALATSGRPFPTGGQLLDLLGLRLPLSPPKPWRATEAFWRGQGINVRSTLWNGPRGGAPFTAACLKLLAATGLPCWPWVASGERLLVEGFPAAQLTRWRLPCRGYDGAGRAVRETIWRGLAARVSACDRLAETAVSSADALDAVVLALTARAVSRALVEPLPGVDDEGWIACQP